MSFTPGWGVVPGEVATAVKMSQLGANDDYLNDRIDKSTPAGIMAAYAGTTDPTGWLICDGRIVSRTTYADLFAAIGTSHGAGDGSTTFQIPDARERTIAGFKVGSTEFGTIGQKTGEKSVTLSEAQMPSHSHGVNDPGHAHSFPRDVAYTDNSPRRTSSSGALQAYGFGGLNTNASGTGIWLSWTGGNQAHNNIQPTIAENWIIKY